MLTHPGEEIKETLAAGDLFRMRVEIPPHLVGKPVSSLNMEGKILVAGVDRGGKGFIPVASSTFQEGDYAAVVVQKDALETPRGTPATDGGALTDARRDQRRRRGRTAPRVGPGEPRPHRHADRAGSRRPRDRQGVGAAGRPHDRRRVRALGAREGPAQHRRRGRRLDRGRRGQPRHRAARQAGVRRSAGAGPGEPSRQRVAVHRAVGRGRGGLAAAHPDRDGGGGGHRRRPRSPAAARARAGSRSSSSRSPPTPRRPAGRCTRCACHPTRRSSRSSARGMW